MIKIITQHPVAVDSNDHLFPLGTINDNTTSEVFISEVEKYFGLKKIAIADLGCAGGQLIVDFHNRGHLAVGLEGSDINKKTGRANWKDFVEVVLFTCDITKEWKVEKDGEQIKFDCITAWEVVEHIAPADMQNFLKYISDNLKDDGVLMASVNITQCYHPLNGAKMHGTVAPKEVWLNEILNQYFDVLEYPFSQESIVRPIEVSRNESFLFFGKKKK